MPASVSPPGVVITYAVWNAANNAVEVAGFVQGIATDSGTCTLTLTLADTVETATHPATADASDTECGTLSVPGSQLRAGTWLAVLTFSTPSGKTTSASVSIGVQP